MRVNGVRKYYFEKRLKRMQAQYCSDKKINRSSVKQITSSDIIKPSIDLHKTSNKENINFNEPINKFSIKRNLFSQAEEDKENCLPNQNTYESKDTQDNSIKNNENNNNLNYYNYKHSNNNYFNKISRNGKLNIRYSMPIVVEKNFNTNNGKDIGKNENKYYKIDYDTGISFDGEIDDLINSTTSKIENEKDQKYKENKKNIEFQKYLEKVKKVKLSKNNLTKGTLAIIQIQISHAKESILDNKYVTYVNKDNYYNNEDKNNICFRLGKNNMCVCGHGFSKHYLFLNNGEFKSNCKKCECKIFKYIPVFPEETNEYSKAYLLDFKYDDWKAGCKCGHDWTKHNFIDKEKCEECECKKFKSEFFCGVCGDYWENHITLFQTKETREKNGESVGKEYEPFNEEQIANLLKD